MQNEAEFLAALGALVVGRRQVLAAAIGSFAASPASVTAAPAPTPTISVAPRLRGFGVFSPMYANNPKEMASYVQWLGRTPKFIVDNADETQDWPRATSSCDWMCGGYASVPATIVLGVPLLVKSDWGKHVESARGDFDAHFTKMAISAKKLRNRTINGVKYDVFIRIGWEFNGGWMPWLAGYDPKNYIANYRRVVGLFRAVDPGFKFDWCTTLGYHSTETFKAWPGADVVDVIGIDIYDEAWGVAHRFTAGMTDAQMLAIAKERWQKKFVEGENGLLAFSKFALTHNKQISFPEWGCRNRWSEQQANGGDNPYFIEACSAFFDSLGDRLAYHAYFERADQLSSLSKGIATKNADGTWSTAPTQFPRAAARFQQLYGTSAK